MNSADDRHAVVMRQTISQHQQIISNLKEVTSALQVLQPIRAKGLGRAKTRVSELADEITSFLAERAKSPYTPENGTMPPAEDPTWIEWMTNAGVHAIATWEGFKKLPSARTRNS